MLILGIETATSRVGCAIGDSNGVCSAVQTKRDRHHGELLAPHIKKACTQAGVALQDIEAVAVDIGPGLYTGLRVGITTAITIAHALSVPMIGVTSLDLVAYGVRDTQSPSVAVIDARRGEVFWARYDRTELDVQPLSAPAVDTPEAVVSQLRTKPSSSAVPNESTEPHQSATTNKRSSHTAGEILVAGDGAIKFVEVFAGLMGVTLADSDFAHPSAESLVLLAQERASKKHWVSDDQIAPLYLRRPDAKANWGAQ